jgi:dGTPase
LPALSKPLAHLRYAPEATRGRRYPQVPHPYRNEFQRDRDRIIHSRAFRRLEDKTQVFGAGYSDHFRNRLTHTLEVTQVARTAAAALGLDEDLTEALALVHDVGHPPFAHAGEKELDRQLRAFGLSFNHNLHALRLVETFEQRYAAFPGLNLTFEVREGIVKHSLDFEPGEYPDLAEYLPGQKPPLEAQLIDLADEAAYNTSDLDDGYSAGLLTLDDLAEAAPLAAELREQAETSFPGAAERERFQEIQRLLLDRLVSGLIEGTAAAAAAIGSIDDLRHSPERAARFTPEAAKLSSQLKALLKRKVYDCAALTKERERSQARIAGVFERLLQDPSALPEGFRDERPLPQAIRDYIASMTDGYFTRVADTLLGPG